MVAGQFALTKLDEGLKAHRRLLVAWALGVAGLLIVAEVRVAWAQSPSVQPAFGVVRPLVIHAENCRLLPLLQMYRWGCREKERVLHRRERYFNVGQGEHLDISVRQLESTDGTVGLPSDIIRLATVPLDPNNGLVGSKTFSIASAEELEQPATKQPQKTAPSEATGADDADVAETTLARIEPGAGIARDDFDQLPRLVSFQPGHGEVLEVQVDVKNVSSGEYQGILAARVSSEDDVGEVVPVPVTLRVKDYFPLPLAVLLTGIGVGLWVSSYVSRKKDVDEIIIQSDQLQRQVEIEHQLHESFRTKIENYLRNVLFDVRRNEVEHARQNLNEAFMLWDKWRVRPRDWTRLFEDIGARIEQIDHVLPDTNQDARLVRLREDFSNIKRKATDKDFKYEDGSQPLSAAVEKLERFYQCHAELTTIVRNFQRLSNQEPLHAGLDSLRQEFLGIGIEDADAVQRWMERAAEVRNQVRSSFNDGEQEGAWEDIPPPQRPQRGRLTDRGRLQQVGQFVAAAQWTTAAARTRFRIGSGGSARSALWRRRAFNITGYSVLMVVLAGSGFNELYAQNAVFGAEGFSDYLTLFAWGFGAEASRSSFAQLMSSWGHPAGARPA